MDYMLDTPCPHWRQSGGLDSTSVLGALHDTWEVWRCHWELLIARHPDTIRDAGRESAEEAVAKAQRTLEDAVVRKSMHR